MLWIELYSMFDVTYGLMGHLNELGFFDNNFSYKSELKKKDKYDFFLHFFIINKLKKNVS